MGRGLEAYDYRSYDTRPERTAPTVSQPPELKVLKTRQNTGLHYWTQTIAIFLGIVALFSAVIYNQMMVAELTSQLEGVQSEYDELKDEHNSMEVKIDEKMSLRTIESIATLELGMSKAESYQLEYIDLGTESAVLYAKKSAPSAKDYLLQVYTSIKEYFAE